jgi:hypothetical protein
VTLPILQDDALSSTREGFALTLCLPWIRSLPYSSVTDLRLVIDGEACTSLRAAIDDRSVAVDAISAEAGWWFLQDRLVLSGGRMLTPGIHTVTVSFALVVPYLPGGSDGPLVLPFSVERSLEVAPPWTLAASAFNWTADVIRAERTASDIAVAIVADRVATVIEVEEGQLWRSFPEPSRAEAVELRDRLRAAGGRVSIVGVSIDDWLSPGRRRDDDERLAFLRPQLQTAFDVGAEGVRLPIGQAGPELLRRLQPTLHELGLTLYEEIQGQQAPDAPQIARAIDDIAALDDPRIRLLVDTSMLMPALPPSFLEQLAAGGIPPELLGRLTNAWLEPATLDAVVALLRSGAVPPPVHTLYMNLLVRFGRSSASELRGILPLVGAFHLKFWDLDDTDGRVSQPLRDLGSLLRSSGFSGTLCSEWGGHEWLDEDAAGMTRRHLALAREALGGRADH